MQKIELIALILIFILLAAPSINAENISIGATLKNDRYHLDMKIFMNFTATKNYDLDRSGYLNWNETKLLLMKKLPEMLPEIFGQQESYMNYIYFKNLTVDSRSTWILLNTTKDSLLKSPPYPVNSTIPYFITFTVEFYFNGSYDHTIVLGKNWSGELSLKIPDGWSYISSSLKNVEVKNGEIRGLFHHGFFVKLKENKYYWMSIGVDSFIALIFGIFIYVSYKRRKVKKRITHIVFASLVRNIMALVITLTLIFYFLWVLGPSLEARVAGLAPISSRLFLVKLYNLDKPWYIQFYRWWESVFTGKLLTSLNWDRKFTIDELKIGMIKSTYIFALSTFLSYFVSTYLGTFSGKKRKIDVTALIFLILYSIPTFIAALLFLKLSALNTSFYLFLVTPFKNGLEYLRLLFPAFLLSMLTIAKPYLLTKNVAIKEYRAPYVFTFKAVGMEKRKIRKYVRRTSLIPIITDSVLNFGWILTAQVFVEVIFRIKGMGYLLFLGTMKGNPFEVQLSLVYLAFVMIGGSILADTTLFALDPRVRR